MRGVKRQAHNLPRAGAVIGSSLIVLAAVAPLYLLAKQAVTPELESFAWPPLWLPYRLTAQHFLSVLEVTELRSATVLSVAVASVSALLATAMGAMLAYAMARNPRARSAGLSGLSAARLLPMIAVAIPLALALIRIGLYDSPSGLGLVMVHTALALPTSALTLFGAFAAIPAEAEEAAYLDGASALRTFLTIDLPQVRGALAASLILSFILSWDEFGYALLIQVTHRTLPPLLYYYTAFGDVGPASALAIVMMVPAIVVVIALGPMMRGALTAGKLR